MTKRTALCRSLVFLVALFISSSAQAQLFRAYLASDGNDANPCNLTAPCRLLPAALAAVASGGEIWMLDSANYNTMTVAVGKSVSILAVPGAVGSILAIAGPAISITADSLKISLRNVVIAPLAGGGGTHGVHMTGGSTLMVEHSVLANLPNRGVYVVGTGKVKIANTIIRNSGDFAVWLQGSATADISGTQMLGNAGGGVIAYLQTSTTTTASVSDSIISGGNEAIKAHSALGGAVARIAVARCTIAAADKALGSVAVTGTAQVIVNNSLITGNNYSFYQEGAGASIGTAGNNQMNFNTTSFGSTTSTPPQ